MAPLIRITFFFFFLATNSHAGNAVNEACKELCKSGKDCIRRCVGHSELMELKADLIQLAAAFHKDPELRLTALRTGANKDSFEICGKSGWSTDNQLICLRSYPTPELMKSCKRLSPIEADQVKCVRNGRSAQAVDACSRILVSNDLRIRCVRLDLSAFETSACDLPGKGSKERLRCLERKSGRTPASD